MTCDLFNIIASVTSCSCDAENALKIGDVALFGVFQLRSDKLR